PDFFTASQDNASAPDKVSAADNVDGDSENPARLMKVMNQKVTPSAARKKWGATKCVPEQVERKLKIATSLVMFNASSRNVHRTRWVPTRLSVPIPTFGLTEMRVRSSDKRTLRWRGRRRLESVIFPRMAPALPSEWPYTD